MHGSREVCHLIISSLDFGRGGGGGGGGRGGEGRGGEGRGEGRGGGAGGGGIISAGEAENAGDCKR